MRKAAFLRAPLVVCLCPGASDPTLQHSNSVSHHDAGMHSPTPPQLNLLRPRRQTALIEALKGPNCRRPLQHLVLSTWSSAPGPPLWARTHLGVKLQLSVLTKSGLHQCHLIALQTDSGGESFRMGLPSLPPLLVSFHITGYISCPSTLYRPTFIWE